MRIERTGEISKLTPKVKSFLVNSLGGVDLDEMQSAEERRADFSCLRALLAVELKTLEEDGSQRIDNLTDELRERDDWPLFLGSAPIESFLKHMDGREDLNRRILNRVGRGITNHLKKANRQLEAHKKAFPRQSSVRMLLLVNEDHEVYTPHVVTHVLWHALKRIEDGRPLYEFVDVVIYLTERHAQVINGEVTLPISVIHGWRTVENDWIEDVGQFVARRWGSWNAVRTFDADADFADFSSIEHIPETMKKHELWRLQYRRTPYLRGATFDQLRNRFDEAIATSTLGMVKGSPVKVSQDTLSKNWELFTHIMEEMSHRGIPVTQFPYEKERQVAAARRLGVPEIGVRWISTIYRSAPAGTRR